MLLSLLVSDAWATAVLVIALLLIGGISVGLFYLGSTLGQSGWRSVKAIGTFLQVVALGLALFALVIAFKSLLSFVMGLVINPVMRLPGLMLC
jgi:hypothetical protein